MANKYKCITCAILNDGTKDFAVKLKSDDGEVLDGRSSQELTPGEYYAKSVVKDVTSTRIPRPQAVQTNNDNTEVDEEVGDISTGNFRGAEKADPVKETATKTASKKASKRK